MIEKIEFTTSAVLASTLVVALLATGLQAKSVMKAVLAQGTKTLNGLDDRHPAYEIHHHHTHIERFSTESMRFQADQRALRKYLQLDGPTEVSLLD